MLTHNDGNELGPCQETFYGLVDTAFATLAASPVCGPKYDACVRDYDCSREMRGAIGATMWDVSKLHFEEAGWGARGVCSKTRQFQDLYECANSDAVVLAEQYQQVLGRAFALQI